jgi:NADH-quinone oxidoreductase subunit N
MNMSLNWIAALPELALLASACVVLLADLFISDRKRDYTFWHAQLALFVTLCCVASNWVMPSTLALNGLYVHDTMSSVLKIAILLGTSAMFAYSRSHLVSRDIFTGEFYVLALFAVLGMMVMVSGANLLVLYVGLELQALCLYAIVAMNRDNAQSSEAAMKYFILGALASGLLLYGMSMIYGATGSLDIAAVYKAANSPTVNKTLLVLGVVFVVSAIAFKLGAVPYHMWVPDVYQGATTPATLFVASVPKLAAFAFALRILVQGLQSTVNDWQMMIVLIAGLSMVVGNLTAIMQTNFKRMLAYSAIANMGFMLLGFAAGSVEGYASSMYYVIAYMVMTLASFGAILLLSRAGFEADQLSDLKGLNKRHPGFAAILLITMFSLSGIPCTVGFISKFVVIEALITSKLVWLAVIAVIASLVGAYYYLRAVKLMYFDAPDDNSRIVPDQAPYYLLCFNALLIIAWGVFPQWLISLCTRAMSLS